jgi:hypothetical protein
MKIPIEKDMKEKGKGKEVEVETGGNTTEWA